MSGWAIETAFAVTLLVAAVLLVRGPVARAFGAHAAYALWLAPLLRAVMPPGIGIDPLLPVPTSSANFEMIIASTSGGDGIAWWDLALPIWAAGAVLYLGGAWVRHHRFVCAALEAGRPLHITDVGYDVVASRSVEGPVATGLVHPLILVPDDFETRFSSEQQRFALWHEQLHHRRGDIWASAAALLITGLLWFNPLIHLALGAFRRDMEAACDASLIRQAGPSAAPAYAETILRCAARPVPDSLCALTPIDDLKRRLTMLKNNPGLGRRFAGLGAAGALALSGLAIAAPAAADQPKDGETREFVKKIEVRHLRDKDVIKRGHPGDLDKLSMQCPGEKFEAGTEGNASGRKENIKFVLCTQPGEPLLPALEKAAAEIEKRDEMPADRKADILSKLRAKIAELRAKG